MRELVIYLREEAGHGLAIDEEVAIVIDKGGDLEMVFEEGGERDSAAEAGKIGQVTDDALAVIARPGKSEADGHGGGGYLSADALEAFDESL